MGLSRPGPGRSTAPLPAVSAGQSPCCPPHNPESSCTHSPLSLQASKHQLKTGDKEILSQKEEEEIRPHCMKTQERLRGQTPSLPSKDELVLLENLPMLSPRQSR